MDSTILLSIMLFLFCSCLSDDIDGSENEISQHYVPCKQGWFLYDNKCYKILGGSKGLNWKQASVNCSLERGHLASISSKELQDFLTSFLLLNIEVNVWIGLHDRDEESDFLWDDGSALNYTNWDLQQPSVKGHRQEEEDCVEMLFRDSRKEIGVWNDVSCNKEQPYLCQMDKNDEFLSPDPRFCTLEEGGGFKYLNACYHVVTEEKSWEDAEEHCEKKFNGYLVSILNKKAEMFINNLVSNITKECWIGIKMRDQNLQKWASGWHVAYKNWDHELNHFLEGTCGARLQRNRWTIAPCFRKLPFICERLKYNVPAFKKPPSAGWKCPDLSKKWLDLDGDSCYIFETNKSVLWDEANYECGRNGGTLASIHSEQETNILHPHVINTQERLFIGLHRSFSNKDIFEWSDGSPIDFSYWGFEEPNNRNEECGELWTDSMKWNDVPCNRKKGFICAAKKVPSKIIESTSTAANECACSITPNTTKITASASKDFECPNGMSTKTVIGIAICCLLVALLTGIVVYHSRYFCKRQRNNFIRDDFSSSARASFCQASLDPILKPEELECRM